MRASLLLPSLIVLASCASPPELLVSQGRLGYLSDRAHELGATIDGQATVDRRDGCDGSASVCIDDEQLGQATRAAFVDAAERHATRGAPLFPERARIETRVMHAAPRADGRIDVRFELDMTSFARASEHPSQPWVYPSDETTSFVASDDARLSLPTPLASLEGRDVTIAVVLGQIAAEAGYDDPASWSRRHLAESLVAHGFTRDRGKLRRGAITVDIVGPDDAPLSTERAADEVAAAFRDADVVYISGHARSGLLAKVTHADRPTLVFLDLCWSYYLDAREQRERVPAAALVVTDGAVVTGSIDNVAILVDGLIEDGGRDRSYRALLARLNDAAEVRARQRAGKVDRELADPEVYGVLIP